ncbi:hypothetical protein [Zoogloea sp. 1C4]|jgi:uncharacterized protein (TIGR02270 family)|uniref:hypothetical protein n=1 Tax=Zoogloea sp. 1C4 TaxID=2570190 RepID=UPI001D16FBE2|nr:hypothetical protein [Zoogloea sp. 1C4]
MAAEDAAVISGLLATTAVKLADRHVDLLAFGWRRRADRLVNPALDFADLVAYDDRIRAALAALVYLGAPARQHLGGLLNEPMRSAELFALTYYALATQDGELLDATAALTAAIPDLMPARVAALQWAPVSLLLELAIDSLPLAKRIGLTGLRHRDCPGLDERTLAWLRTQAFDAESLCAVLQLVRDLGRADLAPAGLRYLDHAQPAVRLAAAQTLLTLGPLEHHGPACDALQTLAVGEQDTIATGALRTLVLHAPARTGPLLVRLASRPEFRRPYLQALGWQGQVDAVPELIFALEDRQHGGIAAAALELITGSDPGRDGWLGAKPARTGRPPEPGDQLPANPDDDALPWPDAPAFAAWWRARRGRFTADQRYFAGQPLTPSWLSTVLRSGLLPWRPLAAEHRQRLLRGPLFPTELPADVQRSLLHELK